MSPFAVSPIDETPQLHRGAVKLAGAHLGVESFGVRLLASGCTPRRRHERPEGFRR